MAMKKRYHTVNGMLIGETSSGVRRGYLSDALGSVVATVDDNGAIENTYRYKPYGSLLAKTGTAQDPRFLHAGESGSRHTKLKFSEAYIRARHLDTLSGRWSTIDPYWPSEPAFTYVGGAPTSRIDPSGLSQYLPPLSCIRRPIVKGALPPLPPCKNDPTCPNQTGSFLPNFGLFAPKPKEVRKPDDIGLCDPSSMDQAAIDRRIKVVSELIAELCSHSSSEPLPGGGSGGGIYNVYAETVPCWRNEGGPSYVSCRIRCSPKLGRDLLLGSYFGKGKPKNGIGCLACCLLRHEAYHCAQIILGGTVVGTYGVECAAFKHELECLKRVKAGHPC